MSTLSFRDDHTVVADNAWPTDTADHPAATQLPHPARSNSHGTPSELLIVLEVQKVLPQFLFGDLIGCALKVVGQLPDGSQASVDSLIGFAIQLQVIPHRVVQRSGQVAAVVGLSIIVHHFQGYLLSEKENTKQIVHTAKKTLQ